MTSNLRVLQIDPGEIALVVVVGEQRVGAQAQEIRERRVVAESAAASRSAFAAGTSHCLYST